MVPVYNIFTTGYELGGDKLPAPAAMAWKAMAELLAKGLDALPPQAGMAVLLATLVGIAIPLLRKVESIKDWVPWAGDGHRFHHPRLLLTRHVLRHGRVVHLETPKPHCG